MSVALRKLGEALRQLNVVVNRYIMLKELGEEDNSTLNHPTIHPSIRLGDLKIRCGAKDFRCDANSRVERCSAKSRRDSFISAQPSARPCLAHQIIK